MQQPFENIIIFYVFIMVYLRNNKDDNKVPSLKFEYINVKY